MRLNYRNNRSLGLLVLLLCSVFLNGQERLDSKQPDEPGADTSFKSRNNAAPTHASNSASPPASPHAPSLASEESSQPESMFDALSERLKAPATLVEVHAMQRDLENREPFRAGGQEILSAAGSYGDFERFLQVLPGVVTTSDQSN